MALSQPRSSGGALVVDANVTFAVSAKEAGKERKAKAALASYSTRGFGFYAPGVIVSETLYILCQQSQSGLLTPAAHAKAILSFQRTMNNVLPPPNGDASLIARAEKIRIGYGCSRSADGLYIALAEELSQTQATFLLTFDADLQKQAARNAPQVSVHLLTVLKARRMLRRAFILTH